MINPNKENWNDYGKDEFEDRFNIIFKKLPKDRQEYIFNLFNKHSYNIGEDFCQEYIQKAKQWSVEDSGKYYRDLEKKGQMRLF